MNPQTEHHGASGASIKSHMVTALFEDHDSARRAVDTLVQSGFSRSDIGLVRDENGDRHTSWADGRDDKGFWESLTELFTGSDQEAYSEGLRRGGYLVSARAASADLEQKAADILEHAGAVDVDERAASWRQTGWSSEGRTAATSDRAGTEAVIPVAEEKLSVGKRAVEKGRVRIHSHVTETPVEEQVTLREERVDVDRRASTASGRFEGDPFKERTVEVQTMREEPVVAKEVHVTEEVAVGKTATERTETVRDTVRQTEVEVDGPDGAVTPARSRSRKTGKTDI